MRTRFIQTEILILLSDNKLHRAEDIADELGVNIKTVYRHVQDLAIRYNIKRGFTGDERGIRLVNLEGNIINEFFTIWEIDYLLELIATDINSKKVELLRKKLLILKEKGEANKDEQ